jgi:hypothetical protein
MHEMQLPSYEKPPEWIPPQMVSILSNNIKFLLDLNVFVKFKEEK